jgi:pimeloyl-ACP methyl ester carboxylesterase
MHRLDTRCYDRGMKHISRSTFVATTAAVAGSSLVASLGGNPAMAASTKPSIVFAHGIWADGSSFSKVIPLLQTAGYEVISTQYSLDTLDGDVAAVDRALGRVGSPAILVGHSYGGQVISAAGTDDRVVGLVYIAALAPDDGETSQSQVDRFQPSDVFGHIQVADGRLWMLASGAQFFCGDLSAQEQREVWAVHSPPNANLFNLKIGRTAWKNKPSWYVLATKDHTVRPELQQFLAKRMGATVTEADSSHVAMLSKPKLVADVIIKAANSVH